ncbi:paraquat-inducible protein A [Confluentimicrobium naphthalenivorans]|uniref:Paraquat-inducible protein A n=2 Tax=Roseobacteraceae TaxID=2854170 RepID=A0A840CF53_9RHOB|nr:paraquat-inducible protein A [Actibacterium naphthalenivorans]
MQVFDMEIAGKPGPLTARAAGLVACRRCGRVHPGGAQICQRCGGPISSREIKSLQRVWAWLFAGMILYIPANIYPMLLTSTLVSKRESTIIGGVIDLAHHGSYGVALIVFVASVMIPIGKFIAISYLALSVQWPIRQHSHLRHRLYEVTDFIGRWSMIDVFVVAILSSLVQLDTVATINPGIAAVSFALSVAFTMLSAQSFDSRTIWDSDRPAE